MRHEDGLRLALGRYLSVAEDTLPARFQLCRRVRAEIPETLRECWKAHAEGMREYERLLANADSIKEVSCLPIRRPNLLDLKQAIAEKLIESCVFCERRCGKNRRKGELGTCRVGYESRVASAFLHFGEEPELVPSGTVFFSGCTLFCRFCQNWEISQNPAMGTVWSAGDFCTWVERARRRGARNVNLVGGEPTPNLHTVLGWLAECGTNVPVVWNSNMCMSAEAMELLRGVVDVYLADFKYFDNGCALRLSAIPRYAETVARNHLLAAGQAELLVRHLVLPNHIECCTKPVLSWLRENLGDKARVNVMSQYWPCYRAGSAPEIARRLLPEEYRAALEHARRIGLHNIETQPMALAELF